MKAVLSTEPGGPDQLVIDDIPAPTAGPGQVVLDVKAVGINFPDVLIIQDMYQFKPPRPPPRHPPSRCRARTVGAA